MLSASLIKVKKSLKKIIYMLLDTKVHCVHLNAPNAYVWYFYCIVGMETDIPAYGFHKHHLSYKYERRKSLLT